MNTISITNLSSSSSTQLVAFIGQNRQKPYRYLRGDPLIDAANALVLEDIVDLNRKHSDGVFIASQAGEIVGLVACDDLPWDTRVLGNQWGALRYFMVAPAIPDKAEVLRHLLESALNWARSHNIECLVCKIYAEDIPGVRALEKQGFLYMDTLLDYVVSLKTNPWKNLVPALPADVTIRLATSEDTRKLIDVARVAFRNHFSRYMVDERIPKERSQNVYAEWIRSSAAGYADWILVAEIGGNITGYSVWKRPSQSEREKGINLGHYSIAGVLPDFSGRGLFSTLTYAGMKLLDRQVDYIEGPVHIKNHPVQRAYSKLFWEICDARHSFHKWLVE